MKYAQNQWKPPISKPPKYFLDTTLDTIGALTKGTTSIYVFIYEIYTAPLQGNYSEALL